MEAHAALRKKALDESAARARLVEEYLATVSELDATKGADGTVIGLTTPLVDRDGFPRGDVDLVRVRELRHRAAELRNDIKDAERRVNDAMLAVHAAVRDMDPGERKKLERATRDAERRGVGLASGTGSGAGSGAGSGSGSSSGSRSAASTSTSSAMRPFAVVRDVADGGPAHAAGLRAGALVVRFGDVTWDATRAAGGLGPVASQVRRGVPVRVDVLDSIHDPDPRTLEIVPDAWAGNGLLGCFLVPYGGGS